jgi:hypothetical protein
MNIEELSHDEMIAYVTHQSEDLEKIINIESTFDLLLDMPPSISMVEEIIKVYGIQRCMDEIETGSGSELHSQHLHGQWWLIWEEYPDHPNSYFSLYGNDKFPTVYLSASPYGWDLEKRIHGSRTLHGVIYYLQNQA